MSNQRPVTQADLVKYYVRGMPLLKMMGYVILGVALATLTYEILF